MIETEKSPENLSICNEINIQNNNAHIYSISKTRYKRPSRYLSAAQVERIFNAGEKAYAKSCALNRHFTIHYDDIADVKRPNKFVQSILDHSRKWLQRRGIPVAYVYVIENGKYKGIHVHLLIHIPVGYQREYKKALHKWMPFSFKWPDSRIEVTTIDYPQFGNLHPLNGIYGVSKYICKGINPKQVIRGIDPIYQGEIYGQRYGISDLLKCSP